MNKKLFIISIMIIAVMVIGAGAALASNGNNGASLEDKLEAIQDRVDEGSMTREEADAIIEEISSCDGDCEDGELCTNRPEEGRGIFGSGAMDGNGYKGGGRSNRGNGQGQGRGQNRTCDGTCEVADAA